MAQLNRNVEAYSMGQMETDRYGDLHLNITGKKNNNNPTLEANNLKAQPFQSTEMCIHIVQRIKVTN